MFENWYLDNWITFVYQPDRSTKLTKWEVVHTMEQGTRYEVDETKSKWTKILVTLGNRLINQEEFLSPDITGNSLFFVWFRAKFYEWSEKMQS